MKKRILFCVISVLCVLLLQLSIVFSQPSTFSTDSYVLGDIIHTLVCPAQEQVQINCLDTELQSVQFNDTCMLYAFDSRDLSCANPTLILGDGTRQSIPLDSYILPLFQYSTFDTQAAQDVAKEILVAQTLSNTDRKLSAIQILRDLRNNDEKCWPMDECSIAKTTDILFLLDRANLTTEDRVYQDALLWLESLQTQQQYENWFLTIQTSSSATCELRRGTSQFQSFSMDGDSLRSMTFTYDTTSPLNITCSNSFQVTIHDAFNAEVVSGDSRYDSDAEISYFILGLKPGCLPFTVKQRYMCDTFATAQFLLLDGISSQARSLGESFFENHVFEQQPVGILAHRTDMLLNIYAYGITQNTDLFTGILYNQNNDGSFGDEKTTLEALRILDTDNDWIFDANRWLAQTYQRGGWNTLYSDVLMFELYHQNITPIRFQPELLRTTDNRIRIDFSDQTMNDYNFSMQSGSQLTFTPSDEQPLGFIQLSETRDGLYTDYIVSSPRNVRIPVAFSQLPTIEFTLADQYYVIDTTETIRFPIQASDSLTQCVLSFSDIFFETSFFAQEPFIEVAYYVEENGEYTIEVTYECDGTYLPINDSFTLSLVKESRPPFTVTVDGQGTQRRPYVVTIRNQLQRNLPLSVFWEEQVPSHQLPDDFVLEPQASASITIRQTHDALIPFNETRTMIIESLGYKDQADIFLEVSEFIEETIDPQEQLVISQPSWMGLVIWISVLLVFFALVSVFIKYILDQRKRPKEGDVEDVVIPKTAKEAIFESRVKHAGRAVEVYIELQRSLGKDDKNIMTELLEAGYEDEEVLQVFDDLNALEGSLKKHLEAESKRLKEKEEQQKDNKKKE